MQRVGATPGRAARLLAPVLHGVLILAGCAEREAPRSEVMAGAEQTSFLHDAPALSRAMTRLTTPLARPIRALGLSVYEDRILLQVQESRAAATVVQYRLRAGELLGPTPVELEGPGALADNVFPLERASLELIPRLVARAEQRAGLPGARAVQLSLKRNLPASMEVRFELKVAAPEGSRRIEARRDGTIVAVQAL